MCSHSCAEPVFIPWEQSKAGTVIEQAARSFPPGRFTHLNYSGQAHELLEKLSNFDEVYVVGHGSAVTFFQEYIYPSVPTGRFSRHALPEGALRFDELGTRLIQSGLKAAWGGDLKLNICYSAKWPDGLPANEEPFGNKVAKFLREQQYRCKMFAFRGAPNVTRSADGHRVVPVYDFGSEEDKMVRAKENRVSLPIHKPRIGP